MQTLNTTLMFYIKETHESLAFSAEPKHIPYQKQKLQWQIRNHKLENYESLAHLLTTDSLAEYNSCLGTSSDVAAVDGNTFL